MVSLDEWTNTLGQPRAIWGINNQRFAVDVLVVRYVLKGEGSDFESTASIKVCPRGLSPWTDITPEVISVGGTKQLERISK